uniref:Uncharacterized protein n=1 Tax=Heterorhabditis bacteriophora TaxID=37862 RepID=A0A1I7WEV1_HETBA
MFSLVTFGFLRNEIIDPFSNFPYTKSNVRLSVVMQQNDLPPSLS